MAAARMDARRQKAVRRRPSFFIASPPFLETFSVTFVAFPGGVDFNKAE